MAEGGGHRLLRVPRGAHKLAGSFGVQVPRHRPVATIASAAGPEGSHDMGPDDSTCEGMAASPPNPSPVAECTLCRQPPEVGAVCPNRARTDLCGGCPVTGIPTAILDQAAKGCLSALSDRGATAASRSGFKVTDAMGVQLRVAPDQRRGLRSRACWYSAWRAPRMSPSRPS